MFYQWVTKFAIVASLILSPACQKTKAKITNFVDMPIQSAKIICGPRNNCVLFVVTKSLEFSEQTDRVFLEVEFGDDIPTLRRTRLKNGKSYYSVLIERKDLARWRKALQERDEIVLWPNS